MRRLAIAAAAVAALATPALAVLNLSFGLRYALGALEVAPYYF